MKKVLAIFCGAVVGGLGLLIINTETATAASYNDHVEKAKKDAISWRNQAGSKAYYDYAWISNKEGGDRIEISHDATCAEVQMNIYGEAFENNYYRQVLSSFSVGGRTGVYIQNQPNTSKTGYNLSKQTIPCFDVRGLGTKKRTFRMDNTGTKAIMFNGNETPWSPSQSSYFDLDIVRAPAPWDTSATSTVSPSIVFSGQTISWTHTLQNNGPAAVSSNIFNYAKRRVNGVESSNRYGEERTVTTGKNAGRLRQFTNSYKTTQDDIGAEICEQLAWAPKAVPAQPDGRSGWACARVRSDFDLYPRVTINDQTAMAGYVVPGENIDPKHTIINAGTLGDKDRVGSNPVSVTEFVVKKEYSRSFLANLTGSTSPFSQTNSEGLRFGLGSWTSGDACTNWLQGRAPVECRGEKYQDSSIGRYQTREENLIVDQPMVVSDDAEFGDLICRMVSIKGYNHRRADMNEQRISVPVCVMVAKQPKVQFSGADVRSNGHVYTSSTLTSRGLYGSWAEFAIMSSNGAVRSTSGAALSTNGAVGQAVINESERNRLTFANVNSRGTPLYGHFGGSFTQPSVAARFPISTAAPLTAGTVDVGSLSEGAYSRTGDLVIDGGEVQGKVVVQATGRVTITGDLTYANGPYASTKDLPQLIIIAREIVIDEGVARVDAWLIAQNGYVSTCGAVSGTNWTEGLNATTCSGRLTVNGPIIAKHVYLRRTFGESGDQPDNNPGTPAETLNLRPDAYLYGSSQSQSTGSIRTMHLKELPPRF